MIEIIWKTYSVWRFDFGDLLLDVLGFFGRCTDDFDLGRGGPDYKAELGNHLSDLLFFLLGEEYVNLKCFLKVPGGVNKGKLTSGGADVAFYVAWGVLISDYIDAAKIEHRFLFEIFPEVRKIAGVKTLDEKR